MFSLPPSLRQSLALFLSLSSGHVSLWGLTVTLQMQPCLSLFERGLQNQWNVEELKIHETVERYSTVGLTQTPGVLTGLFWWSQTRTGRKIMLNTNYSAMQSCIEKVTKWICFLKEGKMLFGWCQRLYVQSNSSKYSSVTCGSYSNSDKSQNGQVAWHALILQKHEHNCTINKIWPRLHEYMVHGLWQPQWVLCSELLAAESMIPLKFNFI